MPNPLRARLWFNPTMSRSPTTLLVPFLLCALMASAACGGGDDDPVDGDAGDDIADADPNAPDAPPNQIIDASQVPTTDAPFVPGPDAAPESCNFIANSAAQIQIRRLMQQPPAPTGGTIVDGTYQLVADDIYMPSMPPDVLGDARGTMQIAGSAMELVHAQDLGEDTRSSSTFVTNNTAITFSQTCPTVNDLSWDFYSATADSLTMQYEASANPLVVRVRVYDRVP